MQPIAVTFVLPSSGGGGGSNSVVQEAIGLSRLGCRVDVAVDHRHYTQFKLSYAELDQHKVAVQRYSDPNELATHLHRRQIVVATTNASIFELKLALDKLSVESGIAMPRIAYYVQDYEPLFYPPGSEAWMAARASYTHIPNAVLFAKTRWLQDMVYKNHGVRVAKVTPSIDHEIYYPDLNRQQASTTIVAMLRPSTPRRAPFRTTRIMNILADKFGNSVNLAVFGCASQEVQSSGLALSQNVDNRGRLRRVEVPSLLRQAHLFLDLSDFQAFGRTGAESMACGCVPLLPVLGGVSEFAVHGRNAYVVDTRSDREILNAIEHFIQLDEVGRTSMYFSALETAGRFTIAGASLSEFKLFNSLLMQ